MAASYAFAVGSVRAREGSLLTRQDMEGLMLAGSDRELASLLRDKGYGDPAGRGGTEELLREETVRCGTISGRSRLTRACSTRFCCATIFITPRWP